MYITDNLKVNLDIWGYVWDENYQHIIESYNENSKTLYLDNKNIKNAKKLNNIEKFMLNFNSLIEFCGSVFESENNIERLILKYDFNLTAYDIKGFENSFLILDINKNEFYEILYKFIVENEILKDFNKNSIKDYKNIVKLLKINSIYEGYEYLPENENYSIHGHTENTLKYFNKNFLISKDGLSSLNKICEMIPEGVGIRHNFSKFVNVFS